MKDFENNLEKYAELAIRVGVNLQRGQQLVISASIKAVEFVRKIVKNAYLAGAKDVIIEWTDDETDLLRFMYGSEETLKEFPLWKANGLAEMAENGAAFLGVSAPNPDVFTRADPIKTAIWSKTKARALSNYYKYAMSGGVNLSRVLFASQEWANKVFPNLGRQQALEKLWDYVFAFTKANLSNPIEAWKEHSSKLKSKIVYLTRKQYKKLFYKSEGTNLVVELPDTQKWVGGLMTTTDNIEYTPSIPNEEICTAPLKTGTNGVVKGTMPINYRGQVIENFSFTFKDGRVIDFTAEKGYEALKIMLGIDDAALYLGEVALVPYKVSNSKVIFYDTLYDENASCHFALGNAYPFFINDGDTMSKEEIEENNFNISLMHVDFMVGSADLDIDGLTKDGKLEPIFRKGNWVE